jgi:hypothetical protein
MGGGGDKEAFSPVAGFSFAHGLLVVVVGLLFRRFFFWVCKIWTSSIAYIILDF